MADTPGIPEDLQLSDDFRRFVQLVRDYLRDYPDLNRLVAGLENSDLFIVRCVLLALDEFAGTPPPLGYFTLESLVNDYHWTHGLLLGTLAHILRSTLLLANRNAIAFSDGGITVNLESRLPMLQALEAQIRAEWRQALHDQKIALNLQMAQGIAGAPSEYSAIHGYLLNAGMSWLPI